MSGLVVVRGESASMSLTERIRTFFKEVQVEIRKVSWPTRNELRDSTIVVIATVLIVAAYVGAVDRVLGAAIGLLFR
jgi:preprotein translocase subunit SecE